MKTNFKSLLSVLAIVAGIAATLAFTSPAEEVEHVQSQKWFEYLGDVNGNGQSNPMNYQEIASSNPIEAVCPGTQELCAILVPEDGDSGCPTQQVVDQPANQAFKDS